MKSLAMFVALSLACAPASAQEQEPAQASPGPATTAVVMQTALGDIRVTLEIQRAPATARNFLRYVDEKRFDGTSFYRAVRIGDDGKYGLVQGGVKGDRKLTLKPVAHEAPATTGLHHISGSISMARGEPGSATGDFFFVLGDLPALDGAAATDSAPADPGYAVFGRVSDGLDVVRAILELPRVAQADSEAMKGQMLAEPVKIVSVRRAQ